MIKVLRPFIVLLSILHLANFSYAEKLEVVKGAGPSTFIVKLFFEKFSKEKQARGYEFRVPLTSVKHAGGIESSDVFLFGRTGRPLNKVEKSKNKDEIFLCRVPVAFAAGTGVNISSLTINQIKKIYSKEITNWETVGGPDAPIFTIGREKTEALFSELKKHFSFFEKAHFDLVVGVDDAVVNILKSKWGKFSIGFGAKPNFDKADISSIIVDELSVFLNIGLVYDKKNSRHPLLIAVSNYAHSKQWAETVKSLNLLPPE